MDKPKRSEFVEALQRDWRDFRRIMSDLTVPIHARMGRCPVACSRPLAVLSPFYRPKPLWVVHAE